MVIEILYGAVAGLVGAIVMAIIMMLMGKKETIPMYLAKNMLGDKGKAPMLHMGLFTVWGAIYGAIVGLGYYAHDLMTAAGVGVVSWLVLGLVMLPKAGAGMFGMNHNKMWPVMSLVMALIWAAVAFYTYTALLTLVG